jgi:hypothetical protein
VGVQKPGRSPSGTNTAPKRFGGFAAVLAVAVKAGTIASRSGNASVAPIPRRTVRRGKAVLKMNIGRSLLAQYK